MAKMMVITTSFLLLSTAGCVSIPTTERVRTESTVAGQREAYERMYTYSETHSLEDVRYLIKSAIDSLACK